MPFAAAVTTEAGLRELYAEPGKPSLAKEVDRLDVHCRAWIAHSPFVVMATTDDEGRCDVSPKGGPPGFVRVIDNTRLAIPDLSGNNRLDSLRNIVSSTGVALLFCIPGIEETMRVNGTATVTTDPDVLAACRVGPVTPKVAIGIDVVTAFIHCGKALRRAGMWDPSAWPDTSALPAVSCILKDHYALPDMNVEAIEQRLDESYSRMWLAGGR
ncbi:MAG: pyridoxamine 5'-phosphate oxidase family protein [Actinobacteria bacterium]|nr:pyridoxamine 5'-phosphate oxidase family protein [Actinomycetota bacterium]